MRCSWILFTAVHVAVLIEAKSEISLHSWSCDLQIAAPTSGLWLHPGRTAKRKFGQSTVGEADAVIILY